MCVNKSPDGFVRKTPVVSARGEEGGGLRTKATLSEDANMALVRRLSSVRAEVGRRHVDIQPVKDELRRILSDVTSLRRDCNDTRASMVERSTRTAELNDLRSERDRL